MSFGDVLRLCWHAFSKIYMSHKDYFWVGDNFNLKIWEDIYVHLHKCTVITLHVIASMNTTSVIPSI